MENIQSEEERQQSGAPRHIAEAYSTNDRQKNLKKYSFWMLTFIAFLIFSFGSGTDSKRQKRAKKLRNKAESMPDVEIHKAHIINQKAENDEKYGKLIDAHEMLEDEEDADLVNGIMEDEDDLDMEVMRVYDGVKMAEEDEIETNESMLTTAVKTMEESIKFYLGGVFGYGEDSDDDDDDDDDMAATSESADVKLTEEQLDTIAKKISERLESDVKSDLRARADSVKEEKMKDIEKVLEEDKEMHLNSHQIADDVKEAKDLAVEDLKDEIDEAAIRVKDRLPDKVKRIRNEVVQEVTGKKLDEIEQKKRTRKEKKQELVKKFNERQADMRAKEEAAMISQSNRKGKEQQSNDSDDSKGDQNVKRKPGPRGIKGPRDIKKPLKKIEIEISNDSGDESADDEESKQSEDESPRRPKTDEKVDVKQRNKYGSPRSRGDDRGNNATKGMKKMKENIEPLSKKSDDSEDNVAVSSRRRAKDASVSEDE